MDSPVLAPPADDPAGAVAPVEFDARPQSARSERVRTWVARLQGPLIIYLATRVLYLLIAIVDGIAKNRSLPAMMGNWDGAWYTRLTNGGYPHDHIATHLDHWQTTLGFFPLYSMLTWVTDQVLFINASWGGLIVALVGGFVGVVLIEQLAREWWGEPAARRAVLFFCLFPGSIVFSMDYSEGVLIPLAAGCLLALQHRRWVIAGVCAAFCTAVGPIGLAIIPACIVAAGQELYLKGWHRGRGAVWAPLLAPIGVGAFAAFLWSWTGTPFASFYEQRYGWNEKSSILAIPHDISRAYYQLIGAKPYGHTVVNLNLYSGVIGAVFLLVGLWWMLRGDLVDDGIAAIRRARIPLPAIVWTLWVATLTLTSWNTPPNPRMLLCAFPVLMVYAAKLKGLWFAWLLGTATILLLLMSWLTYVGTPLRP